MLVSIFAIKNTHVFEQNKPLLYTLAGIDVVVGFFMSFLCIQQWYLACTGSTTLDYLDFYTPVAGFTRFDYSFSEISDNIFRVFGTMKFLRILSPSMRDIPFSGIEWAFHLHDQGYDQNGLKKIGDVEMV